MKITRRYLTVRGLILFIANFIVLFSAINYQRNALFWAGYGISAFIITGIVITVIECRQSTLKWVWDSPNWVFANTTLQVSGHWDSTTIAPHVMWTKPLSMTFPHSIRVVNPGLLRLTNMTGVTEHPLGLVKTSLQFPEHHAVWVYPAPVNHYSKNMMNKTDSEATGSIRSYNPGDIPNRILKKTQTLPESYWKTRTNDTSLSTVNESTLSWNALPNSWPPTKKAEQLVYDIKSLPIDLPFTLVMADGTSYRGSGVSHQHQCWQLLANACNRE